MTWVTFKRDFDFDPAAMMGRVTIAYKADTTRNVTRECARLAIEKGAAEPVTPFLQSGQTDEVESQ